MDGRFADNELLIYDSFIKVWDFYDSIGWTGPDGEGTPSLLKMDMVDQNGEVIQNAYYEGREWGFESFAFNRIDPEGENIDIMAHEFSHCVTQTSMTTTIYKNDAGAINEGMSDILGNLVEMLIAYDPEGAWIIGENEGEEGPYRSMKDPHAYRQPEFVWDSYYLPNPVEANSNNDFGGVHYNSSLLNFISYKLDQAGMPLEDQFYYWINVALAMTPSTDFPQMAELLPWCMEQAGYPEYVDAVKKAVEEGLLTLEAAPVVPPKNTGFVRMTVPENPIADPKDIVFRLAPLTSEESYTVIKAWVEANTIVLTSAVPEGIYMIFADIYDDLHESEEGQTLLLTDYGWVLLDDESIERAQFLTVVPGYITELPSLGLGVYDLVQESA